MQFRRCVSAGVRCLRGGLGRWVVLAVAVAAVSGTGFPPIALGGDPAPTEEKKPAAKSDKGTPPQKLEEENLVLQTHDRLQLALTYYPRRR